MPRFSIDPSLETPVQTIHRTNFTYRYAYARSADSRSSGDVGQDYLSLWHNDELLTFVLCDGVSQSFYGEIAARYLAENLVGWLARLPVSGLHHFHVELSRCLSRLTEEATEYINEVVIPSDVPQILQEVLEQKRGQGSQTTFVCGRVEFAREGGANGRLYLAWMGDSPLRLWQDDEEVSHLLGGEFVTQERWSTKDGLVGPVLHSFSVPRQTITRVLAYSDGLDVLNGQTAVPDTGQLNDLIQQSNLSATSDDIVLLDLQWPHSGTPAAMPPPPPDTIEVQAQSDQLLITWEPGPQPGTYYHLEMNQPGQPAYTRQVDTNQWPLSPYSAGADYRFRVRAISGTEPGAWSQPQEAAAPTRARLAGPNKRMKGAELPYRRQTQIARLFAVLMFLVAATCFLGQPVSMYLQNQVNLSLPVIGRVDTPTPEPTNMPTMAPPIIPTQTLIPTLEITAAPTIEPSPTTTPLPSPTATIVATPTLTAAVTVTASLPVSSTFIVEPVMPVEDTPTAIPGTCYLVVFEWGLSYWDEPNGTILGVLEPETVVFRTETAEVVTTDAVGDTSIWLEFNYAGEIVWIARSAYSNLEEFLMRCPR